MKNNKVGKKNFFMFRDYKEKTKKSRKTKNENRKTKKYNQLENRKTKIEKRKNFWRQPTNWILFPEGDFEKTTVKSYVSQYLRTIHCT